MADAPDLSLDRDDIDAALILAKLLLPPGANGFYAATLAEGGPDGVTPSVVYQNLPFDLRMEWTELVAGSFQMRLIDENDGTVSWSSALTLSGNAYDPNEGLTFSAYAAPNTGAGYVSVRNAAGALEGGWLSQAPAVAFVFVIPEPA